MRQTVTLILGLLLVLSACSPPLDHCVPGMSSACVCPSGDSGAQVCRGDGTYGTCTCSAPPPGTSQPGDPPDPKQVPCSSDLQCTSLPGYACNDGYQPPICALLNSSTEGSPCDTVTGNELGTEGARFCRDRLCRHTSAARWTCHAAPLTAQECLDGCRDTAARLQCPGVDCMAKCAKAQRACATRGGLSSVYPHCGDGGWALCGEDDVIDIPSGGVQ